MKFSYAVIALSLALAFGRASFSQKQIVLPLKGEDVGSIMGYIAPPAGIVPTRQQCLYSTSALPKAPVAIREVAFRSDGAAPMWPQAKTITTSLGLSISSQNPSKPSFYFAKNIGKSVVRVFSGTIQLPQISRLTPPGWQFRVPFTRPFLVSSALGPCLVLDFVTTKSSGYNRMQWGIVNAREDIGYTAFQGIGYNCHFQKTRILWQVVPGGFTVGRSWTWSASPIPGAGQPGLLALGDAGWKKRWGTAILPLDLKSIGAPGCTWGVRPILFFPFVVAPGNYATVKGFLIPQNRALVNYHFFIQGAYRMPSANALGWLFLPSVEYGIGSGEIPNAGVIGAKQINSKTNRGLGFYGVAPRCRLTY